MSESKVFDDWSSMSPQSYINSRVDEQLAWYELKSSVNKTWHYRWQVIALIATALIPVFALSSDDIKTRIAVACFGVLAAIASGVMSMYQFRDQWTDYRSTAERLKYEKFLFLTGSVPYNNEQSFSLFVNRIESIIINENSQWSEKQFTSDKNKALQENN